ncbi:tRNA isopentenyltransferase [Coprinopsis cinerea okayama7|uniref:tRNA isopentenyltransferase n=1 Tax=Coprinopsis cinerea (strain Okayama-7 / 130 / ATCC MYA-4618 / FGSC 9003) TaxID=240176 RepID=A8NG66_COPC7|nr:tRNA isopentenyltransferase [Coprinopsis cinerea okayama7\|eukprot:XP_001833491.2 tRNA isopentenyltransferase [Coprinopsis cinerea okayama7\
MLKPLIAICGTTGVGKSKLAIDLALHLSKRSFGQHGWKGARVINADAMQVYRGLDVITNKVSAAEMQGVDHLLMGFKEPGEQYVVGEWVEDALKLINEMHQRKEIPIVVGGTSYWIQHLIFPNRLAKTSEVPVDSSPSQWDPELHTAILSLPDNLKTIFECLPEEPPSAKMHPEAAFDLHTLLTHLDPSVGQRWHWKDTRKVLHSLSIIKNARRRASAIIAEQGKDVRSGQPRFRTLCFWLFAEQGALEPRLDERVDQMIEKGLLDEINELRAIATAGTSNNPDGPLHDYTLGIYQSIGYKEFHDYLNDPTDQKAFDAAVERMKLSTRQYAKKQISWIRNKLLPAVRQANVDKEVVSFYALDATEVDERWFERALNPAINITEKLLNDETLPDPRSLSPVADRLMNVPIKTADPVQVLQARKKVVCSTCTQEDDRPVMIEEGEEWDRHVKSRVHKRILARLKRIEAGIQPPPKKKEG